MVFLIFVSFLLCQVSCSEEENEVKYIVFNKERYCAIGEETSCNSKMLRDDFLLYHNIQRRFTATKKYKDLSASNMLQMEWDETLADGAQKYVESCFVDYPVSDGLEICGKPSAVTNFHGGVNYHRKTYGTIYSEVEFRIQDAISNWTHYLLNYDISKLNSVHIYQGSGVSEDSWSQVVRATTWKIGCALADSHTEKSISSGFVEIMACFYGNTKLKKGEEIYKPGEICSSCPLGTHCNDGLCEVEPNQCPVPGNDFPLEGQDCPENSEEGEVLWECDLQEYGEQCEVVHPCSPVWNIDLVGHFKTITVKGDCVSANVFREEISVEVPSCFRFQYIKGGNPANPFHTMVMGFVFNLYSGDSIHVMKNEDVNNWTDVSLDIPWTGAVIQVGILVRSLSDNYRQQYITVGNFSVFEGNCS